MLPPPPTSTLFPYTTLFRSWTRLIGKNALFTLGGYVRQDRYHYYPSANSFADLTPGLQFQTVGQSRRLTNAGGRAEDRKSTRLNSSHMSISYAVFCLKKKKQ